MSFGPRLMQATPRMVMATHSALTTVICSLSTTRESRATQAGAV